MVECYSPQPGDPSLSPDFLGVSQALPITYEIVTTTSDPSMPAGKV
jgi:hypothetical protein